VTCDFRDEKLDYEDAGSSPCPELGAVGTGETCTARGISRESWEATASMPAVPPTRSATRAIAALLDRNLLVVSCSAIVITLHHSPETVIASG